MRRPEPETSESSTYTRPEETTSTYLPVMSKLVQSTDLYLYLYIQALKLPGGRINKGMSVLLASENSVDDLTRCFL